MLITTRSIIWQAIIASSALAVSGIALTGCARAEPAGPFAKDAKLSAEPMSSVDQPGAVDSARTETSDYMVGPSVAMRSDKKPTVRPLGVTSSVGPQEAAKASEPLDAPSSSIQQQIRPPSEPEPADTTRPSTTRSALPPPRVGISKGEFLTIGGVVAEVNGHPIYADKVVTPLEPKLAAMAREMDADRFRTAAAQEITDKIVDFIENELEYAAASRYLDQKGKDFVGVLTEKWRQDQISAAGGSEELARRRFAEHGENFDDQVQEQNRIIAIQLFYQNHVKPRIPVSAADMRREYERTKSTKFSTAERAKFRVIKISVSDVGDAKLAADRIADLKKRSASEDFAKLAEFSTDPLFRRGGLLPTPKNDGFFDHGTFAIDKVEDAAWKLEPGQVSDVIDDGNAFYLVKLDEKTYGATQPFESEEVQQELLDSLKTPQFAMMRQAQQQKLMADATVRGDPRYEPSAMQTAIDIAMQRYPAWHRGGPAHVPSSAPVTTRPAPAG